MGYLPGYRGYIPQSNRVPAEQHSDHLTVVASGLRSMDVLSVENAVASAAEANVSASAPEAVAGQLGVAQEVVVEAPTTLAEAPVELPA